MIVLALDTASPAPALALLPDGASGPLVEPLGTGAAETLVTHLVALLSRAGLHRRALGRIAVVSGPGSFTGLRAGTAFARGLARALEVPLVLVPTFEAASAALPVPARADLILEAGRGEVHRARRRDGRLAVDAAPVGRERAVAEAAADGATLLDLGVGAVALAPAAAWIAREAISGPDAELVYGRVSAAEEKRERLARPGEPA
jgi:tRNA threonylcarbamoyl adenosine modification protein YeaZ